MDATQAQVRVSWTDDGVMVLTVTALGRLPVCASPVATVVDDAARVTAAMAEIAITADQHHESQLMDDPRLDAVWHVGTNSDGEPNVYAGDGIDITPAWGERPCDAMQRYVCEHIVALHNDWLARRPQICAAPTVAVRDGEAVSGDTTLTT